MKIGDKFRKNNTSDIAEIIDIQADGQIVWFEFMRTIKFRVWNLLSRDMMPWEFIKTKPLEVFVSPNSLMSTMQFTGLLDKDGKEIYEGDIVEEYLIEERPSGLTYVVGFERGHFTMTEIKSGYDRMGIWNVNTNLKVIGNIYEDSHLLDNK